MFTVLRGCSFVMCEQLPAASHWLVQEGDSGADSDSGSDGDSRMDADGSATKPGKPQRAAKKVRTFCKTLPRQHSNKPLQAANS